jgi:ribosomal protein S25
MNYTAETLDRATGELKEVSLGNWITVTELGERYGVGPKQVRTILHHMGLLQSEDRHG